MTFEQDIIELNEEWDALRKDFIKIQMRFLAIENIVEKLNGYNPSKTMQK